jgi:hypothetical protein
VSGYHPAKNKKITHGLGEKMMPPHNLSMAELARQEGICEQTLYN